MKRPLWTRLSAAALALLLTAALPAEAWAADQESAAAPAEEAPFVETTPVPPQSSPEAPAPAPQTVPSAPQETQPGTSDVAIDETNFPDDNFRELVKTLDGGDDGSFTPDEIAKITRIEYKNQGIKSLKGIEHFTNLTVLVCSENPLTSLDVSQNTKLEWLRCSSTELTSLDVTANTELIGLECNNNQLSELDVSNNRKLDVLECQRSQLRSLDVSNNTALTDLKVMNNQLTTLDTSNNTELLTLNCYGNSNLQIDVRANTKLKYLNCSLTFPGNLDVTNNTALEYLSCYGSALTSLDVSNNPNLGILLCNGNWLTSLDVSQNTALTHLECQNNQLTELDVSRNTALSTLRCQENKLAFLNLENNTKLTAEKLSCHGNAGPVPCGTPLQQLKGFDVNKATSIQGGSFDGGKVNYTGDELSYQYDLGHGFHEEFRMKRVHDIQLVKGQAPTCTTEGWRDYYQCSGCGKSFENQDGTKEITALEAWKTGEGKLDKTPHTLAGEWKHDNTQHWKECSVCSSHAEQAAHTYDSWITVTPPTETTEGLQKHTCTTCGYEETEVLPVIPPAHGGGSSGSSSSRDHAVVMEDSKHGDVKSNLRYAEQGDTVTLTIDPDKGYELDKLTVTDKNGDEIKLTEKGDNKFTFRMPNSKVTIEVSFKLIDTEPENPFHDVDKDAYYYDAVLWAVDQGITAGVTDTVFAPDASCTRAQMVAFLWRANGSPVVNYTMNFTDVPADAYYAEAVRWAVSEGITSGTSATTFSPDATVTRGQTVTFLWRANGSPVVDCVMDFTDVAADAYYAGAVAWAVSEGVTSGTSATTFSADAACTRAQIVTFMYRNVK